MTKEMGHMTKDISREVEAMFKEMISEVTPQIDLSCEFTVGMYTEYFNAKNGTHYTERNFRYQIERKEKKGELKSRLVNFNGRRVKAYRKAITEG